MTMPIIKRLEKRFTITGRMPSVREICNLHVTAQDATYILQELKKKI